MSSRKHKTNNAFNEHRIDLMDDNMIIDDVRKQSTSISGMTFETALAVIVIVIIIVAKTAGEIISLNISNRDLVLQFFVNKGH
jgi:hypothetical protein